jgi:hypothetical protein
MDALQIVVKRGRDNPYYPHLELLEPVFALFLTQLDDDIVRDVTRINFLSVGTFLARSVLHPLLLMLVEDLLTQGIS